MIILKELFSHSFRISKYWNIHYEEEVGDIAWEILQQYENHDDDRVRLNIFFENCTINRFFLGELGCN